MVFVQSTVYHDTAPEHQNVKYTNQNVKYTKLLFRHFYSGEVPSLENVQETWSWTRTSELDGHYLV